MNKNKQTNRIVAIVGRPNVGKSALFNRIAGKRISIVHEESGVTRDRICADVNWQDEHLELIDTGGIGIIDQQSTHDIIEASIYQQVDVAIEDAAVIVFVVDITAGITPLDSEVGRRLHESGRTVILAANKADNDETESFLTEFESFGFPCIAVSALHNRGITDLMTPVVNALPDIPKAELEKSLRIAVVGRPNAGKSSLINRLLNNDRVIVSDIPGTTRDSIEVPFTFGTGPNSRRYVLIDTAGLRKARKAKTAVEKFSIIRTKQSIKQADLCILILDATEGPKLQDKKIMAEILDERKGCILLVNKWDLAETVTQRRYTKALREELPFLDFVPFLFASATSGYNIRRALEACDYVASQLCAELSTGILNRVLREAMEAVQPPVLNGKRVKMYYATQVGTEPVRVRLFVNQPKGIPSAYETYLIRCLRKAFGLEGAPVFLQFRARRED